MKIIGGWGWRNVYTPPATARQNDSLAFITKVKLIDKGIDWSKHRKNDLVFITGDAACVVQDMKEFESWGLPYDIYAVNRSLLLWEKQVEHWVAIDAEESMWFSQYMPDRTAEKYPILRHTIGDIQVGYDIHWDWGIDFKNDVQGRIFIGNTGYLAVLTAIQMGYTKIVIAGMPLDRSHHFYEAEAVTGPNWAGPCYTQWMDFVMKEPEAAKRVKSMGGYSAFILGMASKDWCKGGNGANGKDS
jgi:hypothetical protein